MIINDLILGIKHIRKYKLKFTGFHRLKRLVGGGDEYVPMDFEFSCLIEQNGVSINLGFFYLWFNVGVYN